MRQWVTTPTRKPGFSQYDININMSSSCLDNFYGLNADNESYYKAKRCKYDLSDN